MRVIDGGSDPKVLSGMVCGLKKDKRKTRPYVPEDIAASAGVLTNIVKGHSLQVTMEHLKSGYATAVIINSNVNACVVNKVQRCKEIAEIVSYLECTLTIFFLVLQESEYLSVWM